MPERFGEVVIDRKVSSWGPPLNGSRVKRVSREKMPRFASHWKYLLPDTQPSFLPFGSSSTTPAHSPGAKCVSPMYWMCPGRMPPTHTRWPIMKLSVSWVRITLWSAVGFGERRRRRKGKSQFNEWATNSDYWSNELWKAIGNNTLWLYFIIHNRSRQLEETEMRTSATNMLYLPELLRLPVASQYKSEPRDPSAQHQAGRTTNSTWRVGV